MTSSPSLLGLTQLTAFLITTAASLLTTVLTAKSAPAPAVDCSSLVLNMADCLSFVSAGSTTTKPEGTCCAGLKTVLKTDPECLCEAYRNSAQLGVTLNVTKAFSLPSACHVSAPSVSNCGLSPDTGNDAAPALSPLALSPSSVSTPPSSSIGAHEFAPSPSPGGSGPGSASGSSQSLVIVSVHIICSIILYVIIY